MSTIKTLKETFTSVTGYATKGLSKQLGNGDYDTVIKDTLQSNKEAGLTASHKQFWQNLLDNMTRFEAEKFNTQPESQPEAEKEVMISEDSKPTINNHFTGNINSYKSFVNPLQRLRNKRNFFATKKRNYGLKTKRNSVLDTIKKLYA